MNASNIAFLDERPTFHVREDRGAYDTGPEAHEAAADHAKSLCKTQGILGEALNLAGIVLKSLEDEGDTRATQIHTAVTEIEKKLEKVYNRLDRHEAHHAKLLLAYADLRDKKG